MTLSFLKHDYVIENYVIPSNYLHCQNKLLAKTGHVSTRHESKVIWIFLNFYPLPISIFFYPKMQKYILSIMKIKISFQFYTET